MTATITIECNSQTVLQQLSKSRMIKRNFFEAKSC